MTVDPVIALMAGAVAGLFGALVAVSRVLYGEIVRRAERAERLADGLSVQQKRGTELASELSKPEARL